MGKFAIGMIGVNIKDDGKWPNVVHSGINQDRQLRKLENPI